MTSDDLNSAAFPPIAIVGRGCVLPGALSPDALWQLVSRGEDHVTTVPPGLWPEPGETYLARPGTVATADQAVNIRGGFVRGFEQVFDPDTTGLPHDLVMASDVSLRWLLHAGRQAVRDFGRDDLAGIAGVAAVANLSYPTRGTVKYVQHCLLDSAIIRAGGRPAADPAAAHPLNRFSSGLPADLLARSLRLEGRAYSLDAACASSLYAIKWACGSLQSGEADIAIAAGLNGCDSIFLNIGFTVLKALSPSGVGRPLSRYADGMVPALGAAAVVLKRLGDAVRDGDHIHGVIRGVGISNDGCRRGLLVPDADGQVRAIRDAYRMAELDPASVSLLECHATGAPVGDATEMASMTRVFSAARDLPVGSLKSNIGHLITVAGLAGLLKVTGAMAAGIRPQTLHAEKPIKALRSGPFRALTAPEEWICEGPRRAGISNFGFGGNNAHLVVEEHRPSRQLHQVALPPALDAEPIAICGIGIIVGNDRGLDAFAQRLFAGEQARMPNRTEEVRLPLLGLRFPPNDLAISLGQHTLIFEAVLQVMRTIPDVSGARAGVIIGMGCDAEAARMGLRWQIGSALAQSGLDIDPAEVARLRDSVTVRRNGETVLGAMPNLPANRLNVQNDWQGMGFTVSCEELSGLAALRLACAALASGELDFAVAGAVDLSCEMVHLAALAAVAPDAPRIPADAAVAVALKRLGDAERARDTILATLRPDAKSGGVATPEPSRCVSAIFGHAHAASGLVDFVADLLRTSAGQERVRGMALNGSSPHCFTARGFTGASETVMYDTINAVPGFGAMPSAPILAAYAADTRDELIARIVAGEFTTDGRYRLAICAANDADLERRRQTALAALARGEDVRAPGMVSGEGTSAGEVALVYPSIGSWYPGMATPLLTGFPDVVARLRAQARYSQFFGALFDAPDGKIVRIATTTHYAVLMTEIAREVLGIRFDAALGLSLGESSMCAALDVWRDPARVFEGFLGSGCLEQMGPPYAAVAQAWGLPPGSFVDWEDWQVFAPIEEVTAALAGLERVGVAIIVTDDECTIAGEGAACRTVVKRLGGRQAVRIGSGVAAHRPDVLSMADSYRAAQTGPCHEHIAQRLYFSTSTISRPLPEAVGAALATAITGPLDFRQTVGRALADGVRVFVELGPRRQLAAAIARVSQGETGRTLGANGQGKVLSVSFDQRGRMPLAAMAEAVAALFARGVAVDIGGLAARFARLRGTSHRTEPQIRQLVVPIIREPTEISLASMPMSAPAPAAETEAGQDTGRVAPSAPSAMPLPPRQRRAVAVGAGGVAAELEDWAVTARAPSAVMAPMSVGQASPAARRPDESIACAPVQPMLGKAGRARGARPFPERPPEGLSLDRAQLETVAASRISEVFGPMFEVQDGYRRQCRMPMPPLLLADRVTGIAGEPGSMGRGTIWTETDIDPQAWYLHRGRMPTGLSIEAGQADLLLISWLGCDFLNRGERVYRLLGCEITYHTTELPRAGETVRFQIEIEGHAVSGGTRLFFFRSDARVGERLLSSVRSGQAGFFSDAELANSAGVLWDAMDDVPLPDARLDPYPRVTEKRRFDAADLAAFRAGDVYACFGRGFERAAAHTRTPSTPSGQMGLFDRIVAFDPHGGPWGRGYIRAEVDIPQDAWFYKGHFLNDPCMPGTLMAEAAVQVVSFFMAAVGLTVERDAWIFAPATDEAFKFICRGQVIPDGPHLVTYEAFIEEVIVDDTPRVYAALLARSDGHKVFMCRRFGVTLVPDWPLEERPEYLAANPEQRIVSPTGDVRGDSLALLACVWGRPSQAFGSMGRRLDGPVVVPRLPAPPYMFVTRIISVDASPGVATIGGRVVSEYVPPADAWYFAENDRPVMPIAVLTEVLLQPCGWFASYMGFVRDGNRLFRNLDGASVNVLAEVTPETGPLTIEAVHTRNAEAGPITLVFYDVICRAGATVVATLSTGFGFFSPDGLRDQKGLPTTPQHRAAVEAASDTRIALANGDSCVGPSGIRLPSGSLRMVDEITGFWPVGGRRGLGRIRGRQAVVPGAWYFKAHFFQDPVQPGSLGLEALMQLARVAISLKELDRGLPQPKLEIPACGRAYQWKFRGQISPQSIEAITEVDIVAIEPEPDGLLITIDGSVWVDGTRIYELTGAGIRLRATPPPGGRNQFSRRISLRTMPWLSDHRLHPDMSATFPMLGMAEWLSREGGHGSGRRAAIRQLELRKWIEVGDDEIEIEARPSRFHADGKRVDLFVAGALIGRAELDDYPPSGAGSEAWPLDPSATPVPVIYMPTELFHGPVFQVARDVRRSPVQSVFHIDIAQALAYSPTVLFDGLCHGIPHFKPEAWFAGTEGRVTVPYRLDYFYVFAEIPTSGRLEIVTRPIDMPTPRTVRCEVQVRDAQARPLAEFVMVAALMDRP